MTNETANTTAKNWNAKAVEQDYNLTAYQANLIVQDNASREIFEKNLKTFQDEYNACRVDAINTLAAWAVTDDETKDIDTKVWNENNRINGVTA